MSRTEAPLLVIINGPPASGKTTLGMTLSAASGLPFLTKDGFKELLADALNVEGVEWSAKLGAASFELLYHVALHLLVAGNSVMLEGNFNAERSSEPVQQVLRETGAVAIQIMCRADGDLLIERYQGRNCSNRRHTIHLDEFHAGDEPFRARLRAGQIAPLDLDGQIFEVNTSQFDTIDIAGLISKIKQQLPRTRTVDGRG
ncbi:MAG TPA: AAA family ATPase [Nitrolancea sp.]|nr:AAA family ATPase [Nitrolancea sp.]